MAWPRFKTRDLLLAMALLAVGFTWPISLIFSVPIVAAGILAKMEHRSPLAGALFLFASIYSVVWLALVYAMWSVAWGIIGHQPSPGNDDPSYISPVVSVLYGVAVVLSFGLPIAFELGGVSLAFNADSSSSSPASASTLFAKRAVVLFAMWIAFALWLAADPGQAISWFFD